MESLIYNYNAKVFNSIVCIAESVTGIENIPASFEYLPPRVAAHTNKHVTAIVKLHGVERALCHCGNDRHIKVRMFAAISQQQQAVRVGGC